MKKQWKSSVSSVVLMVSLFGFLFSLLITPAIAINFKVLPVEEIQANIGIPEDAYVISSNTTSDDLVFEALGIEDGQSVLDINKANNVLLDVIASDLSYEITVTMIEDNGIKKIGDFNLLDHDTLLKMTEEMKTQYSEQTGATISDVQIHQSEQARYVVMDISKPNNGIAMYGRQFYTIYNGQAINVVLGELTGNTLDADLGTLVQDVVDNLRFSVPPSDTSQNSVAISEDGTFFSGLGSTITAGAISGLIFGGIALLIHHFKKTNKS